MRKQNILAAAVGALVLGIAGLASAADVSDTMQLTVSLESECMIHAPDANFTIGGSTSAYTSGLAVNVLCNMGTPYTVSVDRGLNDGANANEPTQRALLATDASGNTIPYELFQDLGMTQAWGDVSESLAYAAVADGQWQEVPAVVKFNRVNEAPTGTYSDTLSFTASY